MAMPIAVPRYTIADLDRLPDDGNRYELLAGVLLVTPAPGPPHQLVLGRLTMVLSAYLLPSGAAVLVTPGAIQSGDDTQLEPDLLVIPTAMAHHDSWRKIKGWWLAVEVSGRGSRIYDRDFKRDAYLALGVREYWRLDLTERRLYRSVPGRSGEVGHADLVSWHPPEMPVPLTISIPELLGHSQPK